MAKGDELTKNAVAQQLDAMQCGHYEVLILDPAYRSKTTGKTQEMAELRPRITERPWDKARILQMLPRLRYQNSQGCHIYIRPAGTHALSLLDDLSKETLVRMQQEGFNPALVVETSPNNYQAWLNHGITLTALESTQVAKQLAIRYGADLSSADWRHLGRLSGFTNCKEKYRQKNNLFPYCRLIAATGECYPQAAQWISQIKQALCQQQAVSRKHHPGVDNRAKPEKSSVKSIDYFRQQSKYQGDLHLADAAYATYAIAHGVGTDIIEDQLRSRDLSHKGNAHRIQDYIQRTLRGAENQVIQRKTKHSQPV